MDVVAALRTFLRVAETGSFSAAAIDLGLTQPARLDNYQGHAQLSPDLGQF